MAEFEKTINAFVFDVLGLTNETKQHNSDKINGVIELLIKLRKEARENKDYEESDRIRKELQDVGIVLENKDGKTSWKLK